MAIPKGRGLGKGLDSLIPETLEEIELSSGGSNSDGEPVMLKTSEVEPNREQPRKEFKEEALEELAESIKQFGIIQPILVQKRDDYYEIIAGERRWRAARKAGLKEVPVIIKDYTEREIVEISLIENIQREDLNPIEEALAYKRLLNEYNLKQEEVAQRVSKSRAAVTNTMRLLKLADKVQEMLVQEMISSGHARALLAIEDEDVQCELADKIHKNKLSVRDIEKAIKVMQTPKPEPKKNQLNEIAFIYEEAAKKMENIIGTKVKINLKSQGKGKIEVDFYSNEEFDRIMDMLSSINK